MKFLQDNPVSFFLFLFCLHVMCTLYFKLYVQSSHIPVLSDSKVPGTHSHTPSIGSQNALSSRHFVSAVQSSPKARPERNGHNMP